MREFMENSRESFNINWVSTEILLLANIKDFNDHNIMQLIN